MNAALSRVDDIIKSLFDGLKERGVEECVNVIIVSDHGMTAYNSSKLVTLNSVSIYIYTRQEYNGDPPPSDSGHPWGSLKYPDYRS